MKRDNAGWMVAAVMLVVFVLAACGGRVPSSDQIQAEQNEQARQEAVNRVGMPSIVNDAELKFARDIYELRDNPQVTWAYIKDVDGALRCFAEGIGYGLPYGVQYTNPDKIGYVSSYGVVAMPQAEPNGLFMPDSAEATWYQAKSPVDGRIVVVYVEERLIITPYELPCKPMVEE